MSVIVALCHFCEVHGPAVIMVTQSRRESGFPQPPDLDPVIQQIIRRNKQSLAGCERCWSLKNNEQLIISRDLASNQTFLSSQYVLQPEMEPILRNVVIRAISCEVPFRRETPLIFSDPSVSTVASNDFFLKDSKARGFQRYYSIVVVTRERQHLISNLKSINSRVSRIIGDMKKMSQETYELETCQSKEPRKSSRRMRDSDGGQRNLKDIVGDQSIYEKVHRNQMQEGTSN